MEYSLSRLGSQNRHYHCLMHCLTVDHNLTMESMMMAGHMIAMDVQTRVIVGCLAAVVVHIVEMVD